MHGVFRSREGHEGSVQNDRDVCTLHQQHRCGRRGRASLKLFSHKTKLRAVEDPVDFPQNRGPARHVTHRLARGLTVALP